MIVGLDTSVVVRVLSGDPDDLAEEAARFLMERHRDGDRIIVSDLVLSETYYALQHHYGVPKERALEALRVFLASPSIEGSEQAGDVLDTPRLSTANPGFVDRVIHHQYVARGAGQVATFEKASSKLPKARVLN